MTKMTDDDLDVVLEEMERRQPHGAAQVRVRIVALRERVEALEAECLRLQLYDRDVRIPQLRRGEERLTALRKLAADMEEHDPEASERILQALEDAPAPSPMRHNQGCPAGEATTPEGTPCACSPLEASRAALAALHANPSCPPSEMAGLRGEMAETSQCAAHPGSACDTETPGVFECRLPPVETKAERLLREEREASAEMVRKAAEPTTAEAVATVRRELDDRDFAGPGHDALSLLERRMVAMDSVLRHLSREESMVPGYAKELMQAALTDAPPVFTLEEVEAAMERTGITRITRRDIIAALRR